MQRLQWNASSTGQMCRESFAAVSQQGVTGQAYSLPSCCCCGRKCGERHKKKAESRSRQSIVRKAANISSPVSENARQWAGPAWFARLAQSAWPAVKSSVNIVAACGRRVTHRAAGQFGAAPCTGRAPSARPAHSSQMIIHDSRCCWFVHRLPSHTYPPMLTQRAVTIGTWRPAALPRIAERLRPN